MRSKRTPRCRRKVLLMRGRKLRRQSLSSANDSSAESVRTSIERKLQQLQRILPAACSEINMETLFLRTAEYIFLLEAKVSLLQNLSTFYGV
ncbi:hypothetical protein QQP08_025635 [Theobroma cacao]|uniref:BHLH domain-containing protein n=1 Tax=Theobroma cacao TaxID=3641 RepID=A0A061GP11_THECC|nr:Uncharacterized protein TCM_038540 [Theobroma cacao]WRX33148.1 hypothetical protein QQP08_025635 [Theobroma cacao]